MLAKSRSIRAVRLARVLLVLALSSFGFSLCVVPVVEAQRSSRRSRTRETSAEVEARGHFERGSRAYEEQRFRDAVREFEAAMALSDRPTIRYNLFRAYNELGDLVHAIEHLRAYLPNEPDARTRAALEERLARMEASLAPATQPAATAPTAAASASSPPVSDSVSATSTPTETAAAGPDPSSSPAPSTGPDFVPAAVVFAVGAVGFGTFAAFGSMSQGRVSSLRAACAPTCDAAQVDEARTWAVVADVGLVVGAIGVGVGTYLLIDALSSSPRDPNDARVTAAFGPTGAYIAVAGGL